MSFKAFRIHSDQNGTRAGFESMEIADLTEGDVVVRVQYSGINYKDALAGTGKGRILRRTSLNGGIDLAGVVESSGNARFKPGDPVLVCGGGLSETLDGGYAEVARVPAESVVLIPPGLSAWDAMAIGTAGFTAALAVMRMEQNGQIQERGPVVVTGATGGVGSLAIDMLSGRGYQVVAVTGKLTHEDYLRSIGAHEVMDRHSIEFGDKPLESATWGGAVDNVGGEMLAWLTRTVKPWGNIASIGLAGGYSLNTTVMPFILRGVSLLGINSIEMPLEMRDEAWRRLTDDLKPRHLKQIASREVPFDALPDAFSAFIDGAITGRTVVKIRD